MTAESLPLPLFLRMEPSADDGQPNAARPRADVVAYRDAECTKRAAIWPWHQKGKPRKRCTYVTFNCYRWRAIWLADVLPLWRCDVRVIATAYVRAATKGKAFKIVSLMAGDVLEFPDNLGQCGDLEISGAQFDSPILPVASLSPAMSVIGPERKRINSVERADV